jgi:hypothetical protein
MYIMLNNRVEPLSGWPCSKGRRRGSALLLLCCFYALIAHYQPNYALALGRAPTLS